MTMEETKKTKKRVMQLGALALILITIGYLESLKADMGAFVASQDIVITQNTMNKEDKALRYPLAKELVGIDGYINVDEGFALKDVVGKKVILVDFWTYSCINCQRTLPYLNVWNKKYVDDGLLIVGVHTPEFDFEKKYENVLRAVEKYNIMYPVVLDNEYATWKSYDNRYWPRKYLIDIDGFIVYDHIGEGGYEETERKIQELLAERNKALGIEGSVHTDIAQPEQVELVDTTRPHSPETYFGALRNQTLGNGVALQEGIQEFAEPKNVTLHTPYLIGSWNIQKEFAESNSRGTKIIFPYQAQKVFMVARSENGVWATVLLDGKPVREKAGADVDKDGRIFIQEDQLYRIIEDPEGWGEHILEIIGDEPGLDVFTFTFG